MPVLSCLSSYSDVPLVAREFTPSLGTDTSLRFVYIPSAVWHL